MARAQERLAELCATLDPKRAAATAEELALMRALGEWGDRQDAAEHALARAEHGTPGIVGAHGPYRWIVSFESDIGELVRLCPRVVFGKYVAVTSIDSGPLRLTAAEVAAGWRTSPGARLYTTPYSGGPPQFHEDALVAYSPAIRSCEALPHEAHRECCAGYHEWYIFGSPAPVRDTEVFVNWCGLRLYDPAWAWVVERFWRHMDELEPESYLADGTALTFATRDAALFEAVLAALSG